MKTPKIDFLSSCKKKYVEEEKSIGQTAKELNTYPNKVRRLLIKQGVELRDKSEAQILALEKGTSVHPTKGKERTQEEKDKIAQSVSEAWTDERKEEKSVEQKKVWDDIPEHKKKQFYHLAALANRKAAEEGSKLEKFLLDGLIKEGYRVEFHKESIVEREKMQLDLFLPKLGLAIEIDGPSHFIPIWGEEALRKKIKADTYKNGLLLKAGFSVLRIKNRKKNMSNLQMKNTLTELLNVLESIKTDKSAKSKTYELEIK